MNVFLLFPMADKQLGPAIKRAFENLGHKVTAVDARLHPDKIYDTYCSFKADLLFCVRLPELTYYIKRIKKEFNPVVCAWNTDTRYTIGEWTPLFPFIEAVDYYFVVACNLLDEWRKLNKNVYWLPEGLQNEVYKKPLETSDRDRQEYACDVSWTGDIGSIHEAHKSRIPYLRVVDQMDVDFKFWGCMGRPAIWNEEHNKLVALSKINLGLSSWPENGNYISNRDYKILGAGGFLLELVRDGLYEIFPHDVLDVFSTPKELAEKIKYWLSHDEEREAMAKRGYEWVHKNTTYTHQIKKALEIMGLE